MKKDRKEYYKAYYQANKEKQKAYYQSHKEEKKAKAKAYNQAHKEQYEEYQKAYRESHKEEQKAYYQAHKEDKKAYYQSHKENSKEYQKDYYQSHKEYYNEYHRNYDKAYQQNDLNSLGQTKLSIRKESRKYLNKHGTKIPGYEIHHCCTYNEPYKFIYCSKETHQLIHAYLREHNIPADSEHYNQIKHLLDDTVVLYGIN